MREKLNAIFSMSFKATVIIYPVNFNYVFEFTNISGI